MSMLIQSTWQYLKRWAQHPELLGNCLLCHQQVQHRALLCDYCAESLPGLHNPCPLCAHPMPQAAHCCGQCLQHPPPWQALKVISGYEQPFIHLIHKLKFRRKAEVANLLGGLLAQQIAATGKDDKPEVLLPVPLHWWRQWQRGYNQSALIGRTLSRELAIPLDENLLKRCKATPPQSQLDRRTRKKNLRNAFMVKEHNYRHVALLDDVVTTGATAEAITRALLKSGVKRVEIWAICRTLSPHDP